MTQEFKLRQDGPQCRITLATGNANDTLSIEAIAELADAISRAGRDPGTKVIRLDSEGAMFLGGRKPGGPKPSTQSARVFRDTVADPILSVYQAIHESQVPVQAEVRGDAHGFGCALVAAADLAVAGDTARFSLPEMEKNLPPTLVLSVFRTRVPTKATAHLTYLGQPFNAAQALAWGIVGEVVPAAEVAARADAIAGWLVSRERVALDTMKAYFRDVINKDFAISSDLAGHSLAVAMTSMS
jgi:enoyl-CoA hydratase